MGEKHEYFKYRTGYHLWLVNKWSNKILSLSDSRIDRELFEQERDEHDKEKWLEPEYTPYVEITWNYRCKRLNIPNDLPDDIKQKMHEATFHHIKRHKHHPEFWSDDVTIESLNKDDRDRPNMGAIVDGTKMPLTYVAAMVADWCAMSDELGGHPKDWADKNVNIRWEFTAPQIELIYYLIDRVWPNQEKTEG